MKRCLLTLPPLLLVSTGFAQADQAGGKPAGQQPQYLAEAPLPRGWPKPGPYNLVTEKSFPAYRAAFTRGRSSTFAFWRLFNHIKRKGIPMTAPVEMGMGRRGGKGEKLGMQSMGFLYQHDEVGNKGMDGRKIEVRDVPAMKALSYTWQGRKNAASLGKAKAALDEVAQKRGLQGDNYRVLGYNGPRTPEDKRTWEMLLVLPAQGRGEGEAAKP